MRFLIKLSICLLFAYAISLYLSVWSNPEIKFWKHVDYQRDQDIALARKNNPRKPTVFFTGGSSCAFSIDPKIIDEICHTSSFNLGLPVSAGPRFLLHQALEKANEGDTIVVVLEPDALTYESEFHPTNLTLGLVMASKRSLSDTVGGTSFDNTISLKEILNYSRPGPGFVANRLGKLLIGKGYRYMPEDIRYRGRIETQLSVNLQPVTDPKNVYGLCTSGRELLLQFKLAAHQKGIKLFYSMPWVYTEKNVAQENRNANKKILNSINSIITTLDDGYLGVDDKACHFSDSSLHLTMEGSEIRSKALAVALEKKL
jgi:hypothetical protein